MGVFWSEFAPIITAGFALLTLPALAARVLGDVGDELAGTIGFTALWVLTMLFFAIVSAGVGRAIAGAKPSYRAFLASGLAAAKPGLLVALIKGVVVMVGVIIITVLQGHMLEGPVRILVIATLIWLLAVWLPAIPLAVAERLDPFAALRRAAALTRDQRGSLAALLIIAFLALLPAATLVNMVVFGPAATPDRAETVLNAMTLADPGFWIYALFELLGTSLIACIPPVVYWRLITTK